MSRPEPDPDQRPDVGRPTDRPGVAIHGPQDPDLRRLWRLAQAKRDREQGRPPDTLEDWNAVVEEYNGLTVKERATIGRLAEIARERCDHAPGGD